MRDFEKLGAFYLGRGYDLENQKVRDDVVLYDSKDLTTHAVVVGMTGSGKTGLSAVLLEEAAIDGIPALVIDPKGDLGNLLLSFPELRPEDFRPWIDESEASREGLTPEDYSARTAQMWREGLEKWGQDGARISRYRSAADVAIYTPGSTSGLSVDLLNSFAAPPRAVAEDSEVLRERVISASSGLLGLLGIEADPIRSREHILISNLLTRAWTESRDMPVAQLIREIQSPPFDKLGVMDLETVFPVKDRLSLAMQLNHLLASPAFSAWTEGEPFDIHRLLYAADGRPRISIFSVAHLTDAERMFFVTLLLNETVAWMRTLSGTGSLRAILYMDEIFGYFPPTSAPPSKLPMLTLLKQARAYGLGVVLATQNPADLDYKGLANAGTWFLGRLQTERDKARVIEGLEGASTERGLDRQKADTLLSSLGKRVFLMHNVHEDAPLVFQTRWALCYLRGPLTREHIERLMSPRKGQAVSTQVPATEKPAPSRSPLPGAVAPATSRRPPLPPTVREVFLPVARTLAPEEEILYRPALLGTSQIHFVSARAGIDHWDRVSMLLPLAETEQQPADLDWDAGSIWEGDPDALPKEAPSGAGFVEPPAVALRAETYDSWTKSLAAYLYRSRSLHLWKSALLKELSRPGEGEKAFRLRLTHLLHERRDQDVDRLRKQYAPRLGSLQEQTRRAEERVSREQAQYEHQKVETVISVGTSLLGALLGRKIVSAGTLGRATTAARSASRATREKEDIARAGSELEGLRAKLAELEREFEQKADEVRSLSDPGVLDLEEITIAARKSDVSESRVALAWVPWCKTAEGGWAQAC